MSSNKVDSFSAKYQDWFDLDGRTDPRIAAELEELYRSAWITGLHADRDAVLYFIFGQRLVRGFDIIVDAITDSDVGLSGSGVAIASVLLAEGYDLGPRLRKGLDAFEARFPMQNAIAISALSALDEIEKPHADFIDALVATCREAGIVQDKALTEAALALAAAYKVDHLAELDVVVEIEVDERMIHVCVAREVVDGQPKGRTAIRVEEARRFKADVVVGEKIVFRSAPSRAGRIAAEVAKDSLLRRLRAGGGA